MLPNGAEWCQMVLNGAEWYCLVPEKIFVFISEKFIDPSSESVSKKFNENQNLVEDILGAAVASITNAHVQENPPCKIWLGSDSEKSSPQSQNRVPAHLEATPLRSNYFISAGVHIYYITTRISNKESFKLMNQCFWNV